MLVNDAVANFGFLISFVIHFKIRSVEEIFTVVERFKPI